MNQDSDPTKEDPIEKEGPLKENPTEKEDPFLIEIAGILQKLRPKETVPEEKVEHTPAPAPAILISSTPVRDVHVYDGTVKYRLEVPPIPPKYKEMLFQGLSSLLSPLSNQMLLVFLRGGNHDPANGYLADDLLYYFLKHCQGEAVVPMLDEQLTDMYRLGQCPQGRVIRLLSLISGFCG